MWQVPASAATERRPSSCACSRACAHRVRGISLVELMVGMTIGLIALLVMVQTFSASEGQKANTVSGADATTTGHIALATIERELLSAGAGLAFVDCEIKMHKPGGIKSIPATNVAVEITPNPTPSGFASRSDIITIRYSASPAGLTNATLTKDMPDASSTMFASNHVGFKDGEMVLIYEPGKHCLLLQLTQEPGAVANESKFNMNPNTGINPPAAGVEGLFPPGGYTSFNTQILSLGGPMAELRYQLKYRSESGSVPNSDLHRIETTQPNPTLPPADSAPRALANDVIALRAQYGWRNADDTVTFSSTKPATATKATDLVAVRVGIVVRAGKIDRSYTAPATIRLFPGDNPIDITLDASELNYRYRTFETLVPLRNTIWNRPS